MMDPPWSGPGAQYHSSNQWQWEANIFDLSLTGLIFPNSVNKGLASLPAFRIWFSKPIYAGHYMSSFTIHIRVLIYMSNLAMIFVSVPRRGFLLCENSTRSASIKIFSSLLKKYHHTKEINEIICIPPSSLHDFS